MQALIADIKQYEERGLRANNYEHMFQMVPVIGVSDSSIIATLMYIKQHPICTTYTGTAGLCNRSRFARITRSIHWTQDQELPFNVIVSDNSLQWIKLAQTIGVSLFRVYTPTATKNNIKRL